MGWGIAGGVLGIILMIGAYKWVTSFATARAGGTYVPTIGSRPRRLAGVPEEAPPDARMPPGMEVLRYGDEPVVVPDAENETDEMDTQAPVVTEEGADQRLADAGDEEPVVTVTEGEGSGIVITEIQRGGEDDGEFVQIENTGDHTVALEGWRLTHERGEFEYVFTSVILRPGAILRVHMWAGQDSDTDVYVGRRRGWWTEEDDTAHLYDTGGVLVYSRSIQVVSE